MRDAVVNLWLDDKRPAPPGWVHVRTVEEAQRMLRSRCVEQASLDYTLRAASSRTGHDLVQWMIETGYWPRSRPRVHSSNLFGRLIMSARIARAWRKHRRSAHREQTA